MNEIDLVRRFRAETSTPDDGETQHARSILMEAIEQDRNRGFGVRERLRRAPRRTIAVALAVVALPASYAIADSAGVFGDGGTVTLTPETAIPAPAPGSESESAERTPQVSGDLGSELAPETAVPAPGTASETESAHRAPRGTVDLTPKTGVPTSRAESKQGQD